MARHEETRAAILLNENPELELAAQSGAKSGFGVGLSQEIEVGGQRGLRIEEKALETEVQRLNLRRVSTNVRGRLRSAFYLHSRGASILKDLRRHQESLLALRARLGAGFRDPRLGKFAAPAFDADLTRLEGRIGLFDLESKGVESELKALLLLGPTDSLADRDISLLKLPAMRSKETAIAILSARSPDVLSAKLRVSLAEKGGELARARVYPNPTLFASVGQERERPTLSISRADDKFVRIGIRMPLPVFDRNQGRVEVADAQTVFARTELERVVRETETSALHTFAEYAFYRQHALKLEQSLALADRTIPFVSEAFEQRRLSYVEFWGEQERWFDIHFQFADALRGALTSLGKLETILGIAAEDLETSP